MFDQIKNCTQARGCSFTPMLAAIVVSVSSYLSGCSTQPSHNTPGLETKITPLPRTHIEHTLDFEQETLYALIAAEIGLVRDRYELGLQNYVEQARATKDVNIAARAAHVARVLKRHEESLEMAELWRALDPGAHEARFMLVTEYVTAERFDDAFREAERLLQAGHTAGFDDIAIEATQKQYSELESLYMRFKSLLEHYPENTELLIGNSVLSQTQEKLEESLKFVEHAQALSPDSMRAAYQRYRVLSVMQREREAADAYATMVELQPNNTRARSSYARMLIQLDISAALAQYEILYEQSPSDPDILLNLGLIELELNNHINATTYLHKLIELEQHLDIAHFGLGEIASANDNIERALSHYKNVKGGRRYVQSSSKAANIIASTISVAEARRFLALRRNEANDEDKESLYVVEASALADDGARDVAIDILSEGLEMFPTSIKLRYARAMQYAAQEKPELAEYDFKEVLNQSPGNAAALNALGYTLLVQTDRIEEAGEYIRRAVELEPEDGAILDSMGWFEFKRGNTHEALAYLRRAFEKIADDEIAAHLGEALWRSGRKSKAKKVWKEGFKDEPNSEVIHDTLKRLNIKWP